MIESKNRQLIQEVPPNLIQGEESYRVIQAISNQEAKLFAKIDSSIIDNLDEQSDEVIWHLLWENHLIKPSEGLFLANDKKERIELIKAPEELHRYKGTPYAIERALEAVGLEGRNQEWFEYDGEPYHFKLSINVRSKGLSEETFERLMSLAFEYKNVRSYLESVHINLDSHGHNYVGTCSLFGEEITVYPWQITSIDTIGTYYFGTAQQAFDATTVYPREESIDG